MDNELKNDDLNQLKDISISDTDNDISMWMKNFKKSMVFVYLAVLIIFLFFVFKLHKSISEEYGPVPKVELYELKKPTKEQLEHKKINISAIKKNNESIPPSSYFNEKFDKDQYLFECFDFINGEQKRTNDDACFTHIQYEYMLPCHFGVAPSYRHVPQALILGSHGRVGLALKKLFDKKKINYIEVKGQFHFDVLKDILYRILDQQSVSVVIDLTPESETARAKINQYFNNRNIPIIRVVKEFKNDTSVQIKTEKAFGNQFLKIGVSPLFRAIYLCLSKNECAKPQLSNNEYSLSNEIAEVILEHLDDRSANIDPKLAVYNESEIWKKFLLFNKKSLETSSPFYENFAEINDSINEWRDKVFVSQSYLSTNDDIHFQRANNTLTVLGKVLKMFPDISIEYIQFWLKTASNKRFFERMDLSESITSRMHVYEVDSKQLEYLCSVLGVNTSMIPEYMFRNIGARLGRGYMLMSSSQDIIPSPNLYEIYQRRLTSPLVILRGKRLKFKKTIDVALQKYTEKNTLFKPYISELNNISFDKHFKYSNGPTGDVQGCNRELMYHVNGWVWGEYVYYADTAFHFDLTMTKVPFYEINYRNNMHQHHKTSAFNSPYFHIDNGPLERRAMFCDGYPTAVHESTKRPNWGISYDFKAKNGSWGHLLYKFTPTKDPRVSDMSFYTIYNDKEHDYHQ